MIQKDLLKYLVISLVAALTLDFNGVLLGSVGVSCCDDIEKGKEAFEKGD